MLKINPYEYNDEKLGVKIKYLIKDINFRDENSLCLISTNALARRMKSKTCSEKRLRYPSLGFESLIEFNSLSQEWRDRITVKFGEPIEQIKESWFAKHYIADREAFDFYVAHRYGENNDKKLKLELVEKYTYNASVLNTVLKVKNNRKAYAKALGGVSFNIWESLSNDVNAFREVEHDLPTTPDSLRYKVNRYKKESYSSLISGKLKLKNAIKVGKEKEQTALISELLNKHTNLDNVLIAQLYNVVGEKMGWDKVTAGAIATFKLKNTLETKAGRDGKRSLKSTMLMQHKRSAPSAPMYYWTLDGWDVELLFQKRTENNLGHMVTTYHNRLTMVVVLDPFNKYPIGYAIGERETPKLIKKALQNAVSHTKELFGSFLNPHQIQSDNYSIKTLRPLYKSLTPNFTPAGVGNSQAKVIEPYFNYLNKKRCKLFDNWSGHNVDSGSKNQPNADVMNKIKKNFPDEEGLVNQIHSIMYQERQSKREEFIAGFKNTKDEFRHIMSAENFLITFGSQSEKNTLRGDGLRVSIDGSHIWYDCFDMNFRKHTHEKWTVHYLEDNLKEALAVSADGTWRYPLQEKYVEGMAIADRTDRDEEEREKIDNFNKNTTKYIKNHRQEQAELVETFFAINPELNQTTAKLLLTDSNGQHKIHKRRTTESVKVGHKKTVKLELNHAKKQNTATVDAHLEYLKSKVDTSQYLED